MLSINFSAFLLAFVAIGFGQCLATYLKYQIGSEVCLNPEIQVKNEPAINTSIILESSQLMPKTCAIRISTSPEVDGLMVTVHNISISNGLNNCDNNIQFYSSPMNQTIQWCDTMDAKTLIFEKSSLDIAFNSVSNNSFYFKLVVTPFEKAVSGQKCVTSAPFSCHFNSTLNCISEAFHCDGLHNCPNGTDEEDCPNTSNPIAQSPQLEDHAEQHSAYHIYNILDYCKDKVAKEIKLESDSNDTISPAIIELPEGQSNHLNQSDCSVRVLMPTSSSLKGLVVGIDYIYVGRNNNRSCDDFIELGDLKSVQKWCQNKTDEIGIPFENMVDIRFHAGSDSNSSFRLVITPFKAPLLKAWCPSNSDLKCYSSGNQCVSKQFKCDYYRNCPNGEDEINCPSIPSTTSTISPNTTTTTTTVPPTTTIEPNTTTTTAAPITTTAAPITTTAAPNITTTAPKTTTKSTTTTGSTTTKAPAPKPMPPGMIALTVIGTLIGVALVGFVVFVCIKRRRANVGYNALN